MIDYIKVKYIYECLLECKRKRVLSLFLFSLPSQFSPSVISIASLVVCNFFFLGTFNLNTTFCRFPPMDFPFVFVLSKAQKIPFLIVGEGEEIL